jgi:hypothetical protein
MGAPPQAARQMPIAIARMLEYLQNAPAAASAATVTTVA